MKLNAYNSVHRGWGIALMGLSLFILNVISACSSEPTSAITPTTPPASVDTPTVVPSTSTQAEAPDTVMSMAEDIASGVGNVATIIEGNPEQIVIVFEETHISPAGQIEIAIMLNRLYERYDLRHMGLEGAMAEEGILDASWFHHSPPFKAGDQIGGREDVVVQLLENGELGSMEMIALIYEDANVFGIEDEKYEVDIPEGAGGATSVYLYKIAAQDMTQSEIGRANALFNDDKTLEAIEFIMSTDDFTKGMFGELNDPTLTLSCEQLVERVDQIEVKAKDVRAEITSEERDDLKGMRTFFQTCSERSDTMVDNALALTRQFPNSPKAMVVGAAHTDRVNELLGNSGVSFAVITPRSLGDNREEGDLSFEAYERKLETLSVDTQGALGELLDGRKKPRPVIGELWAQSKAEIFLLTSLIARDVAGGQLPPFNETLDEVLPSLKSVTILPDSFDVIGEEVIFSVEALNNNGQPAQIWVRAKTDAVLAGETLDERLLEGLSNVQEKDPPSDEPEPTEPELVLEQVSSDTVAKFSKDPAAIRESRLGG